MIHRWRNGAVNILPVSDLSALNVLLRDSAFGGDPFRLQGYYNYIGPTNRPGWQSFYFGPNVDRLRVIKSMYDPTGLFDKPMTIDGDDNIVQQQQLKKEGVDGESYSSKAMIRRVFGSASLSILIANVVIQIR